MSIPRFSWGRLATDDLRPIRKARLPGELGVFTSGLIACRNAVSDPEKLDNGRGHFCFIPSNQLLPSWEWYAPALVSPG